MMRIGGVVIALVLFTGAAPAGDGAEDGGLRVRDVLADFTAYEAACREAGPEARAAKWDEMLAAKWPEFFRDAIYRTLEGGERDRYAAECRETFWKEVAPRLPEIAARAGGIGEKVAAVAARFREVFPALVPSGDVYVTISFSFRGKVVTVGEKDVLALGMEKFEGEGDEQLRITLAHELFHLVHLPRFPAGGGLYRVLWTEGMATYASALVIPGTRMSACLGFTPEKMNRCRELLPKLAADLRANLGANDHRLKRAYFGAEDNDLGIPPEAGYYVGLLLAQALARTRSASELAALSPEQVMPLLSAELARMAEGK